MLQILQVEMTISSYRPATMVVIMYLGSVPIRGSERYLNAVESRLLKINCKGDSIYVL